MATYDWINHGKKPWDEDLEAIVGAINDETEANSAEIAGRLSEPALSATYSTVASGRPGNRCVFLGDSTTNGPDVVSPASFDDSWPTYASILSKQRVLRVRNSGVAGNTTTQMIARFATDVTAYAPNVVTIMGGTNDLGTGALPTAQTNLATLVEMVRAIGAVPVLCTIPPTLTTPSGRQANVIKLNAWIKQYAAAQGIIVLDFYGVLVDPATGDMKSAYKGDVVHPSAAGYAAMGAYAADTLAPLLPAWGPALPGDNTDPNNLCTNGLFITDTNVDGVPDNWTNQGGVTGQAVSLVTGDTAILGSWFKYTLTASSATSQLYRSISSGITAGNRYAFMGRVKSTGTTSAYARIRWTATPNIDDVVMNNLVTPITDGIFYLEVPAPTGATAAQVMLQGTASTGTVQFAQLALYDLTAMGL